MLEMVPLAAEPSGPAEDAGRSRTRRRPGAAPRRLHRPRARAVDLDLRGAALAGCDLGGLKGDRLDLSRADLAGARLAQARLGGCRLQGAALDRIDAAGAVLRLCALDGAQAAGARLDGARLEDSSARGADFSAASLRDARLGETSFERAVLREAVLDGASGDGVVFRGADLGGASLRGAWLDDADFRGADLQGADLSAGRFGSADFRGALLAGARFDDADLSAALFDRGEDPRRPTVGGARAGPTLPGGRAAAQDDDAGGAAARPQPFAAADDGDGDGAAGPLLDLLAAALRPSGSERATAAATGTGRGARPPGAPGGVEALLSALAATLGGLPRQPPARDGGAPQAAPPRDASPEGPAAAALRDLLARLGAVEGDAATAQQRAARLRALLDDALPALAGALGEADWQALAALLARWPGAPAQPAPPAPGPAPAPVPSPAADDAPSPVPRSAQGEVAVPSPAQGDAPAAAASAVPDDAPPAVAPPASQDDVPVPVRPPAAAGRPAPGPAQGDAPTAAPPPVPDDAPPAVAPHPSQDDVPVPVWPRQRAVGRRLAPRRAMRRRDASRAAGVVADPACHTRRYARAGAGRCVRISSRSGRRAGCARRRCAAAMSDDRRSVRRLRLRAADETQGRRAALLIEDALRCASLDAAAGTPGRLVLVRRLALGALPARQDSSQALALHCERQLAAAAAGGQRHGAAADAATAPVVWFRDALEAHVALGLRLASGAAAGEWFWPLAVRGFEPAHGADAGLCRVLASLAALPEAPVAVPAWVRALAQAGRLERLAAALDAAGPPAAAQGAAGHRGAPPAAGVVAGASAPVRAFLADALRRAGGSTGQGAPTAAATAGGRVPGTPRPPAASRPADGAVAPPLPPADAGLVPPAAGAAAAPGQAADAAARDTRTASAAGAAPMAGTTDGRPPAGAASDGAPPRPSAAGRPPPAGAADASPAHDGSRSPAAAGGAPAGVAAMPGATWPDGAPPPRQRGAAARAALPPLRTAAPRPAAPAGTGASAGRPDAAARAPAGHTSVAADEAQPTRAGGLLLLVPVLAALGYGDWSQEFVPDDRAAVARRLFALLLGRLDVPRDDAAWRLAGADGPRAAGACGTAASDASVRPAAASPPAHDTAVPAPHRAAPPASPQGGGRGAGRAVAAPPDAARHALDRRRAVLGLRRPLPPALPGAAAPDAWAAAWLMLCRCRLRREAGIGPATLVLRPARLALTPTHADVRAGLGAIDLRVRRAGLDIDPGWVPWLGRIVAFHYDARHDGAPPPGPA